MLSEPFSHKLLIARLYEAFKNQNAAGMAACYHPDARFSDPAFGELRGNEIAAMWAMLIERGEGNLDISFAGIFSNGDKGEAHWEARYLFSQTGRLVDNRVHARFRFKDDLIIEHTDSFSMQEWLGMAIGPLAAIPGVHQLLARIERRKAKAALQEYMDSNGSIVNPGPD